MATGNSNVSGRKARDRGPDIRTLAKNILDEAGNSRDRIRNKSNSGALQYPSRTNGLSGFATSLNADEDDYIQPDKAGAWLEQHPSPHIQKMMGEASNVQSKPYKVFAARDKQPEFANRTARHTTEPSDSNTPRPHHKSRREKSRTPLFNKGLRRWGLGPLKNAEIYDYYCRLSDGSVIDTANSNISSLREVLEHDAHARQENNTRVSQWTQKGEIARGGFGTVYLWEKQSSNGGPPFRMAVKDSDASAFWQDYHNEGTLIRQLNRTGCENVITVLDWLYKPASPSPFVRTCYEYAEHGDLEDILQFYKKNQLVIPEAFIWHVFWSVANALCYCRHGTDQSGKTIPGWHTIIHGDVKPSNILLTSPGHATTTTTLYPTFKLGDFGVAYSIQDTNPKLRAWKSTFKYGTKSFMAPEIETVNPKTDGNFGPIAPGNLHGTHSDIWSLGSVIEALMSTRFNALKDHPSFDSPFVEEYYSPKLHDLVAACKTYSIRSRPAIFDVCIRACRAATEWRNTALEEARNTPEGKVFHNQILFSKADRKRFLANRAFRNAYTKVNRAPLLDGKATNSQPTPPPNLPTPSSLDSLHTRFRTAWDAGNPEPSIDTSSPSSAFILPTFGIANIAQKSRQPNILPNGLAIPTRRLPPIGTAPPIPTKTKPRSPQQTQDVTPKEQKRKRSGFVDDLPEPLRMQGVPAKRALRSTQALRGVGSGERRVRFDVDDGDG
ncbi:MAG: hypothetical protein Q9170_004471 [Blastenia crenularia]